jgi:patatin-related protein
VTDQRPGLAIEQEFRFAVVMYGGVSLAIYINGVAQELFRLVRATAPERRYQEEMTEPESDRNAYFADDQLTASERVYRELGQRLGLDRVRERGAGDEPDPIRTRFVVDIISGTSAGGINGIFLAKAIANQMDFDVSADLWLETAQLDDLLRGEASWKGFSRRPTREPDSLLNGYRLYQKAREALAAMETARPVEIPGDEFRPAYAEQLDLAITTTDLAGLPRPVRLGRNRFVHEKVHRKAFHFGYGTVQATGEEHNDFREHMDRMLAFAARSTSSFPVAFEPVRLEDVEELEPPGGDQAGPETWMREYENPQEVYFADGGYLDNKPFSYATDALRRRRADVPVTRRLLYVEPDPASDPENEQPPRERRDPYQNLGDMLSLPRSEPIRQDIATVAERNGVVRRLRLLEKVAEEAIGRDLAERANGHGAARTDPVHDAYLDLRTSDALDQLARLAADMLELDDDAASAFRDGLGEDARWHVVEGALRDYDVGFEQRRLSFLHDRINELQRGDPRPETLARQVAIEGAGDRTAEDFAQKLRDLQLALNSAHDDLRRALRAPYARDLATVLAEPEQRLMVALAEPDPDRYLTAAHAYFEPPLTAARTGVDEVLRSADVEPWVREVLTLYGDRFEIVDSIVLPLAYPDLGETNAVEIWRVSPRDAPHISPVALANPVDKLKGRAVSHFGAFFDRSWRVNDMLWGRLDGAETLIDAILPGEAHEELRTQFRVRVQAAILREALDGTPSAASLQPEFSRADDAALVKAFRERWKCPDDLTEARQAQLITRSLQTLAPVLAQHAAVHGIPAAPLRLVGKAAPALVATIRGYRSLRSRLGIK